MAWRILIFSTNVSSRKLSQRERNREAVRNCRKRKREKALELQKRIETLKHENQVMREYLISAGSSTPMVSNEQASLSYTISEILSNSKKPSSVQETVSLIECELQRLQEQKMKYKRVSQEIEVRMQELIDIFVKDNLDHGLNRRAALGFIAHSMKKLAIPQPNTLIFSCLDSNKEIFNALNDHLNLSSLQIREVSKRFMYFEQIRIYLEYLDYKSSSILSNIYNAKRAADSIFEINKVLSPLQLARFVVWVMRDPACKDILESLWQRMAVTYDEIVRLEKQNISEEKKFRVQSQDLSARLILAMGFAMQPLQRFKTAKQLFHPKIRLVDVNNHYDITGLKACQLYIESMGNAFTNSFNLFFRIKSFKHDHLNNKIEISWEQSGHYIGNLFMPKQEELVKELIKGEEGIFVRLDLHGEFVFGDPERPHLITELDINWDVLGLMKQIQNYKLHPHDHNLCLIKGRTKNEAELFILPSEVAENNENMECQLKSEVEKDLDIQKKLVFDVMLAFSAKEKDVEKLSAQVFSENATITEIYSGIVHRGLKLILSYFKRIPNVFPEFKIVSRKIDAVIPLHKVEEYENYITKDISRGLYRIIASCQVRALYHGRVLTAEKKQSKYVEFEMSFEVESCKIERKVKKVNVAVTTQDIMYQLGIC